MRASCSSCEAEIEAESPRCPVCMHERTRAEIFQALRGVDARKSSRRAAALKGAFLMLLGVGGTALALRWTMQNREAAAAAALAHKEKVKLEADAFRRTEEARQREMMATAPDPEASEDGEEPAPRPAPRPVSAVKDWSVRGEIYDLKTLAPVASAKVTFTPEDGKAVRRTSTGADGRFSLSLPKSGAPYSIAVAHPKYDGAWVEDGSPPYKRQNKGMRLDAMEGLRAAHIYHVPLSPPEEDDAVELAFVMLRD